MRRAIAGALMAGAIFALGLPTLSASAQQTQRQEQIYGSQLMTPQERREHRQRLRQARTAEERERLRAEHHTQMQDRARQRGMTLPDPPPTRPPMGRGMGPGQGMGPGSGMGPGRMGDRP